MWIDGSFLTKKFQPNDVDFVFCLSFGFAKNATPEQQAVLNWLSEQEAEKAKYYSHIRYEYPEGDPNYSLGQTLRTYWFHQFGRSRQHESKGIAVLQIGSGVT